MFSGIYGLTNLFLQMCACYGCTDGLDELVNKNVQWDIDIVRYIEGGSAEDRLLSELS